MQVLFDFGNTRIKWAIDRAVLDVQSCYHHEIALILDWLAQHSVSYITVAANRELSAYQALYDYSKQKNITFKRVRIDQTVLKTNYDAPNQFGIDRYLNLIAAREISEKAFCVISAGTAITLDFYDKTKEQHLGGIIVPGISSSLDILSEKTGLCEIQQPSNSNSILGNSTASSIGAGVYFGQVFLVKGFLEAVSVETNLDFDIIVTGGDIEKLIGSGLDISCKHILALPLYGIRAYNQINKF